MRSPSVSPATSWGVDTSVQIGRTAIAARFELPGKDSGTTNPSGRTGQRGLARPPTFRCRSPQRYVAVTADCTVARLRMSLWRSIVHMKPGLFPDLVVS